MFWKRKTDNTNENALYSSEYAKLINRIAEVDSAIRLLETKFKILETNYDNLRGNFNRKLRGLYNEEQKEEQKDLNLSGDIPLG